MSAGPAQLRITRHADRLDLTMDRPDHANALSPEMVEALIAALEEAEGSGVRLCVLRGAGRHFCGGFDLTALDDLSDGDLLWRLVRIETLLQRVHSAPFPVMALAQGKAVGAGADLFAASTWRIAAPDAAFRFPGLNFEIVLGTRRLAALVGTQIARDSLIDLRTIPSNTAVSIGLATKVVMCEAWPEEIAAAQERATRLTGRTVEAVLNQTAGNRSGADDMAALVASACRPGLKDRIERYRDAVSRTKTKPV